MTKCWLQVQSGGMRSSPLHDKHIHTSFTHLHVRTAIGEVLQFTAPLLPKGQPEVWLLALERVIQVGIRGALSNLFTSKYLPGIRAP